MRDFRAGNQNSGEYTGDRKWDSYAGEEEFTPSQVVNAAKLHDAQKYHSNGISRDSESRNGSEEEFIEERCGGACGGRMRDGSGFSMGMPELNRREQGDIMRWNSQRPEPPIMAPERRKRPPEFPAPERPMPGRPAPNRPMPIPEWGNEPPERPMPGRPAPNRPMPIPEWGNEPPERPMPGRPAPNRPMPIPEWGNELPGRPMPEWENPGWPRMKREDFPEGGLDPNPGWDRPKRQNPAAKSRNGAPYFRYDYEAVIEDEKEMEQDLRMLQSMYPDAVKEILPCVEEICDRMEYEGSTMFDEYPDKNTVRRLSDEIYRQTGDVWPREPFQEPDGVMSMQYQEGAGGPLGELIRILLLQEMHYRRCRHRRCRPHMF